MSMYSSAGKLLRPARRASRLDFSRQSSVGNTFNFQGADVEPQISMESIVIVCLVINGN